MSRHRPLGARRDREPHPVPRPRRRLDRPATVPLAVAGQVAAVDPALHRALLPVGGLLRGRCDRVLRDPVHRSLSAELIRLQRRRAALELAGALLQLRRQRHRPLPALHPRRGPGLPGAPLRALPGATVPGAGAGEVVAAGHSAVHRGGHLRRWRAVAGNPRRDAQQLGQRLGRRCRPDRPAGADRRDRAAVHRPLPQAAVRLRPRYGPVGAPRGGLRGADDRPLSTVPARPRRHRPRLGARGPRSARTSRGTDRRPAGPGHPRALNPWPPRENADPGAARTTDAACRAPGLPDEPARREGRRAVSAQPASAQERTTATSSGKSTGNAPNSSRPAVAAARRTSSTTSSARCSGVWMTTSSWRKKTRCGRWLTVPVPPSRHNRLRRSASQHRVHSAPVPWTTKLRVNRPHARRERSRSSREFPSSGGSPSSTGRSAQAPVGAGDPRPSRVCTTPPRSPARAASSTRPIARGYRRASRGIMRPLSPRVPPYIAPSIPTLASARVATAPPATMPWYRSDDRAAFAIAVSALMPARTRGSSWATSATTNRQPSSATAAARTCVGTDSAPPPLDAHRPVTTPPGRKNDRNRPSCTQLSSQAQPLAWSRRDSFLYSSSTGMPG